MDDTKHPLQSLGIVGPLAAILVLAANHVKPGLGLTSNDVAPAIDAADALVGGVLGIVGRWRATKRISLSLMAALCIMAGVDLAACSAQQVSGAKTAADNTVAAAEPTIELACWLAQAADAGFQVYAASAEADPSVVADEKTAMAGVAALCSAPPANAAQAIAAVMSAYKAIVASTPPAANGA